MPFFLKAFANIDVTIQNAEKVSAELEDLRRGFEIDELKTKVDALLAALREVRQEMEHLTYHITDTDVMGFLKLSQFFASLVDLTDKIEHRQSEFWGNIYNHLIASTYNTHFKEYSAELAKQVGNTYITLEQVPATLLARFRTLKVEEPLHVLTANHMQEIYESVIFDSHGKIDWNGTLYDDRIMVRSPLLTFGQIKFIYYKCLRQNNKDIVDDEIFDCNEAEEYLESVNDLPRFLVLDPDYKFAVTHLTSNPRITVGELTKLFNEHYAGRYDLTRLRCIKDLFENASAEHKKMLWETYEHVTGQKPGPISLPKVWKTVHDDNLLTEAMERLLNRM